MHSMNRIVLPCSLGRSLPGFRRCLTIVQSIVCLVRSSASSPGFNVILATGDH
jgi:hypothetical protein